MKTTADLTMFARILNRAKDVAPTKHFLAGASHEPLIT